MGDKGLGTFWANNKLRVGEALPKGIDALADVLQTSADDFGLVQQVQGENVFWSTGQGKLELMFSRVVDPRDLDSIRDVFVQVRERQPSLTGIFVHQWTDGDGNWDVFVVTPQRAVQHADRIRGSRTVKERGPRLRDDIYTLFACDRGFPEPGRAKWAKLLAGPVEDAYDQLGMLAARHDCRQEVDGGMARWFSADDKLQAMFFILPEAVDVEVLTGIYEQLRDSGCPVSFVFAAGERARSYDIFRLSARSYLEHHNQAKGAVGGRNVVGGLVGTPTKQLEDLRWVPRWASHVGCIKEYSVIYGCDETGYYISGPESDTGKGPIPWQDLGRSEICSVLVCSVRPTAPADAVRTVRDALTCASDLAHNRRKWTDRAGGLAGYDEWIRAMEAGIADRFGLGYNAAVWAESRRFAVEFLAEARERLDGDLAVLLDAATEHYSTVAASLKFVSDTYPFKDCECERVAVDDHARAAVEALTRARQAEAAGLDVLAELADLLR